MLMKANKKRAKKSSPPLDPIDHVEEVKPNPHVALNFEMPKRLKGTQLDLPRLPRPEEDLPKLPRVPRRRFKLPK